MKAIVVYESHWGNTAAIARAIADGMGSEARAFSTAEATNEVIVGADLIVAGAPLLAFHLPTDAVLKTLAENASRDPSPPDLSHPSMRSWLDALPQGHGRAASFETRLKWSPGSAAKAILAKLEALGYRPVARPQRFIVNGKYGPLREGELAKAKAWGAELAQALSAEQ